MFHLESTRSGCRADNIALHFAPMGAHLIYMGAQYRPNKVRWCKTYKEGVPVHGRQIPSPPAKSRGCMVTGDVPPPISLTPTSTTTGSRYRWKASKEVASSRRKNAWSHSPKECFYNTTCRASEVLHLDVVRVGNS